MFDFDEFEGKFRQFRRSIQGNALWGGGTNIEAVRQFDLAVVDAVLELGLQVENVRRRAEGEGPIEATPLPVPNAPARHDRGPGKVLADGHIHAEPGSSLDRQRRIGQINEENRRRYEADALTRKRGGDGRDYDPNAPANQYPKVVYLPDGSERVVNSALEEVEAREQNDAA
jgi:hypothetical protein